MITEIDRPPARLWLMAILLIAAMMPFLLPATPALIDMPAHVSRYYIELNIDKSYDLGRFFTYHWWPLPNLGIDLIVAGLGRMMPLAWAVAIACALIPLATVGGIMGTARATYGYIPATSLMAMPLAINYATTYGFVNSCLSVGLALLVFGGWISLRNRGRRTVELIYLAAMAPIILIDHIIGFGVLCLLVGGYLLHGLIISHHRIIDLKREIVTVAVLAWPLLILMLWRDASTEQVLGKWFDFDKRAIWLVSVLRDDHMPWDILSALLLYSTASLPIMLRRRFRYEWSIATGAILLWLGTIFLPNLIAGSDNGASRLIPVALLVTILSVRPLRPLPRWVLPMVALFVIARFAVNTETLLKWNERYREELVALNHVKRGSRIVAFTVLPCQRRWEPQRLHTMQAFATTLRDAYVNRHFVNSAGQLLDVRMRENPQFGRIPINMIVTKPCDVTPAPSVEQAFTFIKPGEFDYIWIIDIADAQYRRPSYISPVWYDGRSVLLQVAPKAT